MNRKTRRLAKYGSDVLINPSKFTVLTIHSPQALLIGGGIFAISEFIHCAAHIIGALDKYNKGEKSGWWFIKKAGIQFGRMSTALLGIGALMLATFFAMSSAGILFVAGFAVSSGFATLHKVRGLIEHWSHTPKELNLTDEEYKKRTNGLIVRALLGVLGTALSVAVILKVAVIVLLIANPYTFAASIVIFLGMAIWKMRAFYNEYTNPKPGNEAIEETGINSENLLEPGLLALSKNAQGDDVESPRSIAVGAALETDTEFRTIHLIHGHSMFNHGNERVIPVSHATPVSEDAVMNASEPDKKITFCCIS